MAITKMALTKRNRRIVIMTFLSMLIITAFTTFYNYLNTYRATMDRASLNAKIYADRIQQDLQNGINITDTLERIVIDNNGEIHDFETAASSMMQSYIMSIQLAPAGKVTAIYPIAGNEAGMIDLFVDPVRRKFVQYSVDQDTVTMQGPFDLKQGGSGIAVRNPVFLVDSNGGRTFWGFTIVIIKIPDIYKHSLDDLESFGYDYCLDVIEEPVTNEPVRIAASFGDDYTIQNPTAQNFEIGGCTWTLAIEPKKSTQSKRHLNVAIGMLALSILVTSLVYTLEILKQFREHLEDRLQVEKYASEHDVLTGLFNRRMYVETLEQIAKDNHRSICLINMDVNGLKIVNDTKGHYEGDTLIKAAADSILGAFGDIGTCYRTGGDEFQAIILDTDVTETQMRHRLEKSTDEHQSGLTCVLAISMGVAISTTENPMTLEEMSAKADADMYADKREFYCRIGQDRRTRS